MEPTPTTAAGFKDIPMHAGGVSWYGDYLYIADTNRGMRVFNMKKILRTDSSTATQAHGYSYILPQIGTITSTTTSGTPLLWSTMSLDRASASVVMTEYTCSACSNYRLGQPRAIRFPFAAGATTFAPTTTASQALQLPWYRLNGVASHNGRWWFNSSGERRLYYWTPSGGSTSHSWISGGESISYWEDSTNPDLLWSLKETTNYRSVFAVQQASYD